MAEPTISVVTPSFNQGRFVERTVRSVATQGVPHVDHLVVDGGSTDGTLAALARQPAGMRWLSAPDRGQADAVNKGIERTSGEIVGWLNSDDVYYPGALAAVRAFFAGRPDVDVVYGRADHVDVEDRVIEPYPTCPFDSRLLREVCFLCQPAVFFRRRTVERLGLLDPELRFALDYELWLRLCAGGARFAFLDRPLAGSRLYPETKTLGQRLPVHTEINDVLRRSLGAVPDAWISSWAHVALEETGIAPDRRRLRFPALLTLAAWYASLRWNGRVTPRMRRLGLQWLTQAGLPLPPPVRRGLLGRAALPRRPGDGPPVAAARRRGRAAPRSGPVPGIGRVGFDVSQTGTGRTGCGIVAASWLEGLLELEVAREIVTYPTVGGYFWDARGPDAVVEPDHPRVRFGPVHRTPDEARAFWEGEPAPDDPAGAPPDEAALGHPDVVHVNNFFCPIWLRRARLVYTLYDLAFARRPDWTSEPNRAMCFRGVFRASVHADAVVAISGRTAADFLELFPHYPPDRVEVVELGSRFAGVTPPAPGLAGAPPGPFLLSVGSLEQRKNHVRMLRAYARYVRSTADPVPLVLAGGPGSASEAVARAIDELDLDAHVRRPGYVDDSTLAALYRDATALLYPSLLEGFGLPVIEALALGLPVLTSREPPLADVAGEGALLVDPTCEDEIEAGIRRLVAPAPDGAPRRPRPVTSWRDSAAALAGVYERVLAREPLAARSPGPRARRA